MRASQSHFLLSATSLAACAAAATTWAVDDFNWTSVEPSSTLGFADCYNATHRCAKLQVPRDWLDPDNVANPPVTIAIIVRPAVVDEDDPSFGGTIITNPGGPGGSGVDLVLSSGLKLQRTADSEHKKYAIMSFDPRGVGLTTPSADCHSDEFARGVWKLENRAIGPLDKDNVAAVRHKAARAVAFSQLCDEAGGEHGIHRFMSTTSVARDMVKIIDDLDGIREKWKKDTAEDRVELRSELKPARLLYWGFSYGSALGQYFASIYPGRVGRMLLEGIVDLDDYTRAVSCSYIKVVNSTTTDSGLQDGLKSMWDTQEVLRHLWTSCYDAQRKCALHRSTDNDPSDIEKRFRSFLAQIEYDPAPYVANRTVVAITKYDVLSVVFQSLYDPLSSFRPLAQALDDGIRGNFTGIYSRLQLPDGNVSGPPKSYTWIRDAMVAVTCGDAIFRADVSIAEIMDHIAITEKDSPDFGAEWTRHLYECRGWTARPRYRFEGPWGMGPANPEIVEGKPAAPILFLTSRADPVTPRGNAFAMAKRYSGSRVLVQNSVGHCASDWPSKCTAGHVKRYWDQGLLPENGETCEVECTPFEPCLEGETVMGDSRFTGFGVV